MLTLDFKAALSVDEDGAIEGLASVFGTMDRGGDVVHEGAFSGATFPVPMLDAHDPAKPVGVWESGDETPEGLRVKGRLTLTVQRARELRDLILEKAVRGLSIGYVATKKAARAGGGRDLFAVDLVEVSIVAVPMHPGARITSAKGVQEVRGMADEKEEKGAGDTLKALEAVVASQLAPVAARLDKIEAKAARPDAGSDGEKQPSAERKAFTAYLRHGNSAPEAELKALSMSSDAQGGYLAPPEFASEILRDLVEFSPIRQYASVRGTSAPSVIYPLRKPFGNAVWDDALDDETETPDADVFGSKEVMVKGLSTFFDISNSLLQDAPAVEAEVRGAAAEDFGLKESAAFMLGDGVSQPEGLLTNADIVTAKNGNATDLKADALIAMLYAMPQTYRSKGVWVMNGTTLGKLRTLKDGQGNYLWQPSYQAGQPETILGRPVVEMIDMPDVAAGKTPILYGDLSGYRILDRLGLTTLVDPYSQATRKRTRYHMGRRVGGRVLYPAYFRKLSMEV